jgi:polyhydroxyalkanoate synthesis regulator phasin
MSLTKEDLSAIKSLIDGSIDALSLQVGQGFNEMSERFDQAEADIADLKSDVAELKTDVSTLKTDMREVKWGLADTVRRVEFHDLRTRVERLEHQQAT